MTSAAALALPPPSVISSFRTDLAIALMGGNVHSEVALTVLILSTSGNPKVCLSTATERARATFRTDSPPFVDDFAPCLFLFNEARDSTPTGMPFFGRQT